MNIRESVTALRVANADRSRSVGAEFEILGRPSKNAEPGASLGYVDSKIVSFPTFNFNPAIRVDGNQQPYVSPCAAAVHVQYTQPLHNGYQFLGRADHNYHSALFFNVENTSNMKQEGYGLLGVRVGVDSKQFGIFLFARNLTDKRYIVGVYRSGAISYGEVGEPRVVGVVATAKF